MRAGVVTGTRVVDGDLARAEGGVAVDADARAATLAAPRDRDVDPRRRGGPQPPVRRRGRVAEHRAVAAREHGGEPVRLAPEPPMPQRVDAAVERAQPRGGDAPVDRAGGEPERAQLRARHDSPLTVGQVRDPDVDARFTPHSEV